MGIPCVPGIRRVFSRAFKPFELKRRENTPPVTPSHKSHRSHNSHPKAAGRARSVADVPPLNNCARA